MSIETLMSEIEPVVTEKNEIKNFFRQDQKTPERFPISRFAT